jgi:hypothetical protein
MVGASKNPRDHANTSENKNLYRFWGGFTSRPQGMKRPQLGGLREILGENQRDQHAAARQVAI